MDNLCERWTEVEALIDRLFDVPVPMREDWLSAHCPEPELRALVARAFDDAPGVESLERGMAQWLPALAEELAERLPDIPGYRMLRFVGAGGMASVFEALRELPGGSQTVAVKLLRLDVHDADERRAFLVEQRILARLQHPNVAQLLDAGFTSTGTPFLALEFVAGDNLLAHARAQGLSESARLALFMEVCAAVEHAHRNLIVHRDLKPSNVLVSAEGRVKLVDFGIAKLLTGEADPTRTQARRMTRAYAAPEQLAGEAVTTAIDVYALGVMLAELVSGRRPEGARGDVSPGGPSDRRRLGVELHAIVQAATRPDPMRRYASVAMLREDLQRYLQGQPLHARPDRLGYRVRKFMQRHLLAVATAAGVAAVLVGATSAGLYEARLARAAARQTLAQALSAREEARRADALKSFLEGLFDRATSGPASNDTVEILLAQGRERVDRDFAMQPALQADILALIGDLERRSGHPERAHQPLAQAATLAASQFGATDLRTLHIETLLAKEDDELGHVREATSRLQHAIDAVDAGPSRGAPEEARALAWLAGLLERSGASTKAIALGERALAQARHGPGPADLETEVVTNLGWIQMDAGHPSLAAPLLREALARARARLGEHHPDVADAATFLASALLQLGRTGEAGQLMHAALDIDGRLYAQPNGRTAWHLNDLANVDAVAGRFDEAESHYEEALALARARAPATALSESVILANLARLHHHRGDDAAAEAGLRDAIERKQRLLGADYADNGRSYDRACLAEILVARGRLDEARTLVASALADARARHPEAHPDTAFALATQARLMAADGDLAQAAALAGSAVAMDTRLANQDSEKAILARLLWGHTLHRLGRDAEAVPPLQAALASAESMAPQQPALVARLAAELAGALSMRGLAGQGVAGNS